VCAGSPESQPCPGLHPQQHGQQGEGGDSAPLPWSAETPLGVLHPALEPSAEDRPGAVGAGPEEAPAMIRGLEPLCWEGRLGALGLVSLGRRRLWGDLRAAARAWRGCERAGEGLVTRAGSGRTRGDGFKLKEGRFRLDVRKKSFTLRVVRPWPRLPRGAVAAPSLAGFEARLDRAGSTLGWWKGSLPRAEGLERDDL